MSIPALVDLNAVVAPRPVDNLQGEEHHSLNTSGRTSFEKSGSASDLEKPGAEKTVVTKQSVFDDSVLAKYVPALACEPKLIADHSGAERHFTPPDSYEGKHRFDPQEQWTEAEERAVVRKCDWRIVFPVCIFFAALQLDRGNVSSAYLVLRLFEETLLVHKRVRRGPRGTRRSLFALSHLRFKCLDLECTFRQLSP